LHEFRYISNACRIMKTNMKFLKQKANQFYEELRVFLDMPVQCMNDIAKVFEIRCKPENIKNLSEAFKTQMMFHYVHEILYPTSNSALINVLIGDLPGFCRDLRFLLEALAKSYLTDIKHGKKHIREKMQLLNKEKKEHEWIKELDQEIGEKRAMRLWGKLSEDIHFNKYVKRIEKSIDVLGIPPSWALLIPCEFWEGDVDEILSDVWSYHGYLCEFIEILNLIWKKYLNILKNVF